MQLLVMPKIRNTEKYEQYLIMLWKREEMSESKGSDHPEFLDYRICAAELPRGYRGIQSGYPRESVRIRDSAT